jgi:hypothetical protein
MDLYGGFTDSDLSGNLLIEHSGHYQPHDRSLTRRQGQVPSVQFVNFILLLSRCTIALKSLLNRVQQILIPKWLCEKFHGAGFQSPDRHRYIAMCGNKDDRNLHAGVSQRTLEIESAHLR